MQKVRISSSKLYNEKSFLLLKSELLYPTTFEAAKKWTMPIRSGGKVHSELSIMYEGGLE